MSTVVDQLSVAELQARAALTVEEAIAIVQALLAGGLTGTDPQRPLGPPSPWTILVGADGSVVLRGGAVQPIVTEIGALLHQLLPPGRGGVPGSLRDTIARAMRDVLAPPFESLDELSRSLARFETRDRGEILRSLFARGRTAAAACEPYGSLRAIAFRVGVTILAGLSLIAAGEAMRP